MDCWPEVRLGEIATFRNGVNYTKENFGSGIKTINVKDFQDYTVPKYAELDEINPDGVVRPEHILADGDVVFLRSNGNRELIGRSIIIADPPERVTHSAFTIRVRFTHEAVEPKFYAYLFRSKLIREVLIAHGGGTNISNLNQQILENLLVPLPPRPTQRRIASILSAYDDLIENNTRRIAIVEEMAQSLYGEWFVHFRYPGHEHVPLVDSPLGPVPEGWKVGPLTEVIKLNPKVRVPKDGEKPFVPMGSLSTSSMLIEDIECRSGNSGAKFQNGDTLFARITPCLENGKTGFVQFLPTDDAVACGSTEFIVMRSRAVCPEYVYLLAREDQFRDHAIKSMTGATGRQRVQDSSLRQFQVANPTQEAIKCFKAAVSPMFEMIYTLSMKNANLRRTRDLLLPRLIAGEVHAASNLVTTE